MRREERVEDCGDDIGVLEFYKVLQLIHILLEEKVEYPISIRRTYEDVFRSSTEGSLDTAK